MSQHEQICYHEAGHVVAAVASGLPVLGVSIDASGHGLARVDVDGWPAYDVCLMTMCGPAAQARWCTLHSETHADPDWEWSDKQAIAKLVAGPALTPDWNAAHELVAAYWTQIERVARALANTNALSREDVIRVVRGNSHPESPMTVPLSVSNAPRRALAAAPKPSPRARLCEALDLAPNATPAQIVAAVQAAFHADDPIDALERVRRALGLPEYASAVDSLKAIESLLGVRIASAPRPDPARVAGCLLGYPPRQCPADGCHKSTCSVAPYVNRRAALTGSTRKQLVCLSRAAKPREEPANVDTGAALELAEQRYTAARDATARARAEQNTFLHTPWQHDVRLEHCEHERTVIMARRSEEACRRDLAAAKKAHALATREPAALAADLAATVDDIAPIVAEESALREQIAALAGKADELAQRARARLLACHEGSAQFPPRAELPAHTWGVDLRDIGACLAALRKQIARGERIEPLPFGDELAQVDGRMTTLAAEREAYLQREEAIARDLAEREAERRKNEIAAARAAEERREREARDAALNAEAQRVLAEAYARRSGAHGAPLDSDPGEPSRIEQLA